MGKQYFLAQNGRIFGPFAATQLKRHALQGNLLPSALVSEDRRKWVSATNVKGLAFRAHSRSAGHFAKQPSGTCRREFADSSLAISTAASQAPVATVIAPHLPLDPPAGIPAPRAASPRVTAIRDRFESARAFVEKNAQRLLADGPTATGVQPTRRPVAKYDVFLSYRRRDGSEIARLVAEKLERIGYRVFLDVEGLTEGAWPVELEERIHEAQDFVPIITRDFFTRCGDSGDVVRKEISLALAAGKNVVPFIATDQPFPADLPADIQSLPQKNGVRYVHEYADQVVGKLSSMLHSGRVGPTRLETPELRPKIIVAVVGLLLGFLYGSAAAYSVGMYNSFWSMFSIVITSIFSAVSSMLIFALPLLVLQAFAAAFFKFRPDTYFGGREWAGFWLIFCPLVVFPTTALVPFATAVFAWWTYSQETEDYALPSTLTRIIAVLLAMGIAFVMTQLIVRSRAATIAARAVGAMR